MQRELYEAGEYRGLAAALAPAAEALVDAAPVSAGERVLDVGAGDGNVTLAAARRGAHVTAVDVSPVQVERGRERTAREGVEADWLVGDAERLELPDGAFDRVLSSFGAVLAPDVAGVARELARVCRPGGTIALTAWPPDSFMGELMAGVRAAAPDSLTFPEPELRWGEEEAARARLAPYADEIRCERRWFAWDAAARAAAGADDCAARWFAANLPGIDLADVRARAVARHTDAEGVVRADYLLVVARKR